MAAKVGDLYVTTRGRTVEILAVDTVQDRYGDGFTAVAYRFCGGTVVHLRGADLIEDWTKIEGE